MGSFVIQQFNKGIYSTLHKSKLFSHILKIQFYFLSEIEISVQLGH